MCRTIVSRIGCVVCALALSACASDGTPDYTEPGPASVGVATTSLTDSSRGRTLPVEVWYPVESSGAASDVIDFETNASRRDTLFDLIDGTQSPLDNALVDVREADIRFVLDQVLSGDALPEGVTANASQVGMLGHSIGSVTAGRVAQNDARIAAVAGLAAPMENIFYGEVLMEFITVPLGLLEATEDNSIGEPGNLFINENFSKANTPAYKLDLVDAGHWSVTNIAGLGGFFTPGCGDDTRQTNAEPFTYVSVESANGHTATFVTAFFAAHLLNEPAALELLRSNPWPTAAPLEVRE